MSHETAPLVPNIFETINFPVDIPGEQVIMSGKIPKPEYFVNEACRLASVSLQASVIEYLGYVEKLNAEVLYRDTFFKQGTQTLQLVEVRDKNLPADAKPLRLRLQTNKLPLRDEFGMLVQPTEISYFYPQTNELKLSRLDNLRTQDIINPEKLEDILALDLKLAPIKPTRKDWFYFYAGLVACAGESLPV